MRVTKGKEAGTTGLVDKRRKKNRTNKGNRMEEERLMGKVHKKAS